jgi:predicted transcriptional regulator
LNDNEDLRARGTSLEEELKDLQSMLQDQQKIYSSHIKELRNQLHDLEDATKGKYEEQIGSLSLELKLKTD